MSNPTWPSSLPVPLSSGYALEPQPATIRTDMESGPARVRRIQTAAPTNVTAVVRVTALQLAVIEAWYEQIINYGASWFDMPLQNGLGKQVWTVQFVEPYKPSRVADSLLWDVALKLQVRNPPRMTPAQLAPYL